MKATSLAGIAVALIAALCAFLPAPASAQAGAYTVAGVMVDETAENAANAQQQGFVAAQRIGFDRLVRRLTLPDELNRVGAPAPTGPALERLVLSQDVEEERRSGTRYIGRLTVRYDAAQVRTLLRASGLTVLDSRTSPVMVVPVTAPDASAQTAQAWRDAWSEGGFGQELAPLVVAPAGVSGPPSWDAVAPYAQAEAAASALYASVRVQGQVATANFVEIGPNGASRDRGEAVARINGSGAAAMEAAFLALASQASERFQTEWKTQQAASVGQRARISASALYSDLSQWTRIKSALEGAATTMISEIRIEAVGRQGALVSFSFIGDQAALAAELRRRGVSLENTQMGPVLRLARR